MSDQSAPRNRKERRAAAKEKENPTHEIPLKQPDRSAPTHKTLYDIAAERNAQLKGGQPFKRAEGQSYAEPNVVTTTINPDGSLSLPAETENPDEDPIGPFANAILFGVTLTMLHFTLDVLVHNQYRQSFDWKMISNRTLTAFPILVALIYSLHQRAKAWWCQALFTAVSVAAGCYLIYSSSKEPYFAIMKRAPPVGTLWVWSVLEMRLEVALISLAVVGGYFWWGGYSIF
jgi:hypothetical protein